jgi:hypothetical protein
MMFNHITVFVVTLLPLRLKAEAPRRSTPTVDGWAKYGQAGVEFPEEEER